MFNLSDKRYLVIGVANEKSICWAIARQLRTCGAEVALCSHPATMKRVEPLAKGHDISDVRLCDFSIAESVETTFNSYCGANEKDFDGIVHGIAFSNKDELRGRFIDTSAENFGTTMHLSVYSLVRIARWAPSLMPLGGSILTLSFDASQQTYPHYNVMGVAKAALEATVKYAATDLGEFNIRVNAISASPAETISARAIQHFRLIGDFAEAKSPMGRRATVEEIAQSAVYLLSPCSSGVTGEIHHVNCGAHVVNMPPPRNARQMAEAMAKVAAVYESP